jgi:hypothetical protein
LGKQLLIKKIKYYHLIIALAQVIRFKSSKDNSIPVLILLCSASVSAIGIDAGCISVF